MTDESGANLASETGQRSRVVLLLLVIAALAAVIAWRMYLPLPDGISRGEYTHAAAMYKSRRGREPEHHEVLLMLGELAVNDGDLPHAVVCFRAVPSDDPQGRAARLQEGQILARLNRAAEAEASFREYLALVRGQTSVNREHLTVVYQSLAFLLSVQLRFEERHELLAESHALELGEVWDSRLYCFPELVIWQSADGRDRLREYLAKDPDNTHLRLASARYLTIEGESDAAWAILDDLHRAAPNDLDVAAAMLECAFQQSDWDRFAKIADPLQEYSEGEPWLLTRMRGEYALEQERWEDAVREFQRSLGHDPADPRAEMGLAKAYDALGHDDERESALARAQTLSEIRGHLATVNESDPDAARQLADLCLQIGMDEAAEIFQRHATRIAQSTGTGRGQLPPAVSVP